jgi:O-antigen ligase
LTAIVASMNFVLPVAAALVAILILPGGSFYFDVAPKAAVVLVGAALAVNLLKRDRFSILLGASTAATLLATVFSTNPWMSFYGSTWRRDGVVVEIAIFILAAAVGTPQNLLRFVTFASIPVAIYAMLQYFGIDPILAPAGYHFGAGEFMIVRPPATLGHAAYLATFLLFAVFAAAAEKSRWRIVPMALAVFAILLSGTRAAILGLVAGAILVLIRRSGAPRGLKSAVLAATIAVAALAIFYVSAPGAKLRARVHWSSEDSLGGARLPLWRDTLRMAAHHPILGYGPETFSREFLQAESLDLERAFPDFYHESPHNIFLDALVSKGIVGLIPLIVIAALALARARGPMGGAFLAMLVSQQFTAFTIPTELFFYLCAGLLLRDGAPAVRWKLWPVGLPFLAFAIYLTAGDAMLASARRALDQGDAARAMAEIFRARSWGASADVYFSRRLAGVPNFAARAAALNCAAFAPQTADDPQNALLNLAALQAVSGDSATVGQTLRRAIEIAPNWYKPHWLLAQVLEREGRMDEAGTEAQAAVDRDGGKHTEVTATLDRLGTR